MKRARLGLLAALLLALPGAAHAASFSCAKASSPAEKLVCADPALGARDEIMAALYEAAAKAGDARANGQRAWLDGRDACRDAGCLAAAYDRRISTLMLADGARALSTAFYAHGSNGNEGELMVFGPRSGYAAISLTSTYVGPGGAEAGDVNADSASGVVAMQNLDAVLPKAGCTLALHLADAESWRIEQRGRCELAAGVDFAGLYKR